MAAPQFKRILLKLSGESLAGSEQYGLDMAVLEHLADEVQITHALGVEIGIVVGGGNIFRGKDASEHGINRVSADHMGMLATVINAIALQNILEKRGIYTRVLSAINMEEMAEPFIRRRAIRHLEKGRIVIFAAGTGNPYFTTDTAAALRAIEIEAGVVLKGTRVDGVYSADPETNPDAELYSSVTYLDCVRKNLKVMDATAITLCRDNKLPIIIFNVLKANNLKKLVLGEPIGTYVKEQV